MSDDGRHAMVLIAFIGSVFSPFYFRARERVGIEPCDHCALNVALYGPGANRWAFTEYPRRAVQRRSQSLVLGDNLLCWNGQHLTFNVVEWTAPLPRRIRGTVRLFPEIVSGFPVSLDRTGRHWWQPLIPRGRVEVRLSEPALQWTGTGYLDCNDGSAPLDEGMQAWSWLRAHTRGGTKVIYDVTAASGSQKLHAFEFNSSGEAHRFEPPPPASVPSGLWRVPRDTHSDPGTRPRIIKTLEDAPFYCRTVLETTLAGERLTAVHESLSLERFRSAWVRALLPFRMRWPPSLQ